MKKSAVKKSLFLNLTSLLLCVALLIGTTFAWFTDTASSGVNKIIAGNLDIEVSSKVGDDWVPIQESTSLFSSNLWEPGHTEYVTLKIENKGTLAFNYRVLVSPV
ncbi:MAG TPA: TasA family protein, partial [Candidatus Avimonas sp.]|nr:TasA family protein [Candidatus Avimonas sp.]